MTLTVCDIDETELIRRFREVLPAGQRTLVGSGDDCAVIDAPEGHFIVTTDVLVEGRHFRRDWSTAHEIGQRAAAQNLADIAGMSGRCSSLVVSLVLPGDTAVDWVVDLVAGFGARTAEVGAEVVGGDLSSGDTVVIAVTAMGYCPDGVVTRSGAQPGDTVAVAGTLGRSAAGLAQYLRGMGDSLDSEAAVAARQIYRAPIPPLELGREAARAGATAMMDISDGLLIDAGRMAKASKVIIDIDTSALSEQVAFLADLATDFGVDPMEWVLSGGEDHGLLATFPPHMPLLAGFYPVGTVRASTDSEIPRVLVDGVQTSSQTGWDHFKGN